jgi:pimeloyl-ACP methyl ester carboxylesterase
VAQHTIVDIGEYRLFMMKAGQGIPLVILEAGAGDDSTTWKSIFQAVAQFTQVMAYDRAGVGQSDSVLRPRTALQLTDDLHKLLRVAQLEGPYILVGHSLGALITRLYAQHYPQDVIGLVLLDGPHPDQRNRFATALMAAGYHQHEVVQPILEMAAGVEPEDHPEGLDFARSLAQVDPTQTFGELPLVVVASGKSHAEVMPDLPPQAALAFDQAWDEMQRDITKLSTKGVHVTAQKSGHYIHWDEPELVVETIHQVVRTMQDKPLHV